MFGELAAVSARWNSYIQRYMYTGIPAKARLQLQGYAFTKHPLALVWKLSGLLE